MDSKCRLDMLGLFIEIGTYRRLDPIKNAQRLE